MCDVAIKILINGALNGVKSVLHLPYPQPFSSDSCSSDVFTFHAIL